MRTLRMLQALAINAVSIYGVFGAHWPVGTAIALYWCENVIRLLMLAALLGVRRSVPQKFGIALFFNAVHAFFLVVILGTLIPRAAPAERLERQSFVTGVILIAALLALELVGWLFARDLLRAAAQSYFRRVIVVHLTIMIGMFGIVLFHRVDLLFAGFAAMKVMADLWHGSRSPAAA